jgi:hypothetical protein
MHGLAEQKAFLVFFLCGETNDRARACCERSANDEGEKRKYVFVEHCDDENNYISKHETL